MYKLKKLEFLYQDLEPYIDTHTMGLHYHKHQKNYLNNLNKLLEKNKFDFSVSIDELYKCLGRFDIRDQNDIIFNLGGVVNHDLYWESINPINKEIPKGDLMRAIINKFGSFDNFKKEFIELALNLKGVGYTFLVKKEDGTVDVVNTVNQDSPLLFGYVPLFNVDLWEHAYYLNYENNKREYLDNFFEVANFNYANRKFEERY